MSRDRGLILFSPAHSSRVLSGNGLVGGNPTMNTPRLRRGGDTFLIFIFYLFWYCYIIYFVCDSASELERWSLLPFWGFPALTCFLFF